MTDSAEPDFSALADAAETTVETVFRDKLEALINSHAMENGSDTPDFVLAEFLTASLRAFDAAVVAREKWYGRTPEAVETLVAGVRTKAWKCDHCQDGARLPDDAVSPSWNCPRCGADCMPF